MRAETREWLSLAPADLCLWFGVLLMLVMRSTSAMTVDVALSVLLLLLSVVACFVGMKADRDLSKFTNRVKRYGYPAYVGLTVMVIWVNFAVWNS